jgi:hypothetical protein
MNDVECKTITFGGGGGIYLKCLRFMRLKQRVRTRMLEIGITAYMNKKGYQPHTNLVKNEHFE